MMSFALALITLIAGGPVSAAQASAATRPSSKPPAGSPATFTLTLKGGVDGIATLRADRADANLVLASLAKQLRIPVQASPIVARHPVTLKLDKVPLSQLLLALAPVVLVDIETGEVPGEETWRAIHLAGFNEAEPPPPMNQVGILIAAGNTDDLTVGSEELGKEQDEAGAAKLKAEREADSSAPALSLSFRDGLVHLRARKQSVPVLVSEIAQRAGISFDLRGDIDTAEIDVDLPGVPLDQVPAALGRPEVRMMLRRDLATGNSVVKGYLVGRPPK